MTTSSGKHLEDFSHSNSLLNKLITSSRGADDLSIGFDRDRGRGQRELTNTKSIKNKYHVRIFLKDIFGFSQHQENGTFGLSYKLALAGNNDNAVLNEDIATYNAKVKLTLLNCMCRNIHPAFNNRLDYLIKFWVKFLPNFNRL